MSSSQNLELSISQSIKSNQDKDESERNQKYSVKILNQRSSEGVSDQNTVLKKREDFAISLRKKKHNEMISTKRKSNMQKSFERTMQACFQSRNANGELCEGKDFIEINDEQTLSQIIAHLDQDIAEAERTTLLRGIRNICCQYSEKPVYEHVYTNQYLIPKALNLLQNEHLSFESRAECLWILTNLSCEPQISKFMVGKYNSLEVITFLFSTYFMKQDDPNPTLTEVELNFLEQLLWFASNILADSDRIRVEAFKCNIDKYLGVIVHNYHSQFSPSIWRVFTWCVSNLTQSFKHMTSPNPEVFNSFVCLHLNEAVDSVTNSKQANDQDQSLIDQLRSDFIQIISSLVKDFDDQQIHFISTQTHLSDYVFKSLKLFDLRIIPQCLKTIGNIIAINEAMTSQFIKDGLLDILKKIFIHCNAQVRKDALWLVSNIAANSEEDAISIIDSGLIINLIYAGKDKSHEIRKEAIWCLGNICYIVQNEEKINQLVSYEIITLIIETLLRDQDSGAILVLSLNAANYLMSKSDHCKEIFAMQQGQQVVEELQMSPFHEVYKFSAEILDRHFGGQELCGDEKMEFMNQKFLI